MALEQIIADLDDLEERVENLNVDQKTNEDILLNVLKRVDETEKDLRKVCLPCSQEFSRYAEHKFFLPTPDSTCLPR